MPSPHPDPHVAESPSNKPRKSPYTIDRDIPGGFEGETVTRRNFMTGTAMAAGGIASLESLAHQPSPEPARGPELRRFLE